MNSCWMSGKKKVTILGEINVMLFGILAGIDW